MLGAAAVGRVCLGNVDWEMHRRHCVEVVEERDFHRSLVVACDMVEVIEGLINEMMQGDREIWEPSSFENRKTPKALGELGPPSKVLWVGRTIDAEFLPNCHVHRSRPRASQFHRDSCGSFLNAGPSTLTHSLSFCNFTLVNLNTVYHVINEIVFHFSFN